VRWRRSPRVLWRTAPGYLVVATVDGDSVEVGGTGCDVWAQLTGWITEEALAAALARQYGAEERVVSPGVRSLLQELHAQGYVDRDD
jgi:hypothetical protein